MRIVPCWRFALACSTAMMQWQRTIHDTRKNVSGAGLVNYAVLLVTSHLDLVQTPTIYRNLRNRYQSDPLSTPSYLPSSILLITHLRSEPVLEVEPMANSEEAERPVAGSCPDPEEKTCSQTCLQSMS